MEVWQIIVSICAFLITVAAFAGVFVANYKNSYNGQERRNNQDAVSSYKTLLEAKGEEIKQLRDDIKDLNTKYTESQRQNGNLQGQIDAYAKLPLQEISNNQRVITQAILLIAKHDGIEGIDVLMQEMNRPTQQHKTS